MCAISFFSILSTLMALCQGQVRPKAEAQGVTFEDRVAYISKHNELRRTVQPTASNMLVMVGIVHLSNDIGLGLPQINF